MKITVKQLKRIIKEEINRLQEVIETDTQIEGTEEELDKIISSMDPDTISDKMYTDSETGEIYLDVGEKANSSRLHPEYRLNDDWKYEGNYDPDDDMTDDHDEDINSVSARDQFHKDAENYADELDNDLMGVAPEDAAPDMARSWLLTSGWGNRLSEIGLTQWNAIEIVQDLIYTALTKNKYV